MSHSIDAARRHCILVSLSLMRAYQSNLRTLQSMLDDVGYAAGVDRLRTDCAWLTEQGYTKAGSGDVYMLTDRGLDVVMGRVDAPGVQRSAPGQIDALKSALASAGTALASVLNGGD